MKSYRTFFFTVILALFIPRLWSVGSDPEPSYQGTNLTTWLNLLTKAQTEQAFAHSSNAIYQLGTNAVSLLVKIAQTNAPSLEDSGFFPAPFLNAFAGGNEQSLKVALGAKVLGPLAEPVFKELTNHLSGNDWNTARSAASTLLNSGSAGIWELMRAYGSPNRPWVLGASLRTDLIIAIDGYPDHFIPILIDIYEYSEPNTREASKELLRTTLGKSLEAHNIDTLMPILLTHLRTSDQFIRSQILSYLNRCNGHTNLALPEIVKRLNDSDETVRLAATNALEAIMKVKGQR